MSTTRFEQKDIRNFGPPYIIAEIGANHNGDMALARQMIQAAADAGADAVKFQSWNPHSIVAQEEYNRNQVYADSPKKHFGSLREMVEKYYLRPEQHLELKAYCDELGIDFASTPFSVAEVDLLCSCDVPWLKVASMDINNYELLRAVGGTGIPVILSTGMARLREIDRAIEELSRSGAGDIALLHCISIYPPEYKDIHLNNIPMLRQTFGLPVGFSDHSIGFSIPLASVALGACIIEKHFTTDKNLPGWDHEISADPEELRIICREAPKVAESLGNHHRTVSAAETAKRAKFRRSMVVTRDLPRGHVLKHTDLTSKRPGTGIPPDMIDHLIGRRLNIDLRADTLLEWSHLQ